ncbi:tape measure protein [Microbacterium paraoxydans]|uniref:Tape measure domain-containing protein n=1 Tax=Microbacterium paraoxydans TaxID=199592 RepID=A0A1H1PVZ2_9MICO|nr:tape measure protein [Microbacterium paraoxydans]SDS15293.1 tape measure domain-containing protein [Microbacterium paraoxydans]
MALDIGTLVAKLKVDDGDFDKKTDSWSTKGAAIGSAFGNVAADAIAQAADMLSDFVGDAVAASDATDKFKQTLEFGGLSTAKIDALTKSTQAYADTTTYSLGDIQSITATLAANGVKDYDTLAMSLGNLNAAAGGSSETFGRVGSVLTQTAGAGKLTTENWNQLTDAIPGASGRLMDALLQAGAYTGNFREAMEKGEITAEEFNAAITQLGTEPIAVEAAKSTETFEGSAGNLAATIQGKLVAALDLVKGPITEVTNFLADLIANSNVFIPIVAGLGAVILAALAPAIWAAVVATAAWTVALLANPVTWIVLAIGALVAAIVWLIMNWDTAVAWISEVWGGFIGWITGVIEGFVAWWNSIWASVGQWISDVWNGFIGWIQRVWSGFVGWLMGIVNGIASWWNGLWSAIGNFIQAVWSGFVAYVRGIFQGWVSWITGALNGFIGFWSGIWNNVKNTAVAIWNGTIAWFQSIPDKIMAVFTGAATWLYNIGRDVVQGLWNGLKSIWESVSAWFQDTFGGIVDTVAGIFGIASPSRVFREFGIYIGEGLIDGLDRMSGPVEDAFADTFRVPEMGLVGGGGGIAVVNNYSKEITYVAEPNASFSAQEEFFAAMGSPRVRD